MYEKIPALKKRIGGEDIKGGVMLRRGVKTQSAGAVPKHLAAQNTPREILRVSSRPFILLPFSE